MFSVRVEGDVPRRLIRGRTRTGRLRALDRFLVKDEAGRWRREVTPWVIDVGFGESLVTVLEMRDALLAGLAPELGARLRILAVESDPQRASAARRSLEGEVDGQIEVREGAFDLPLDGGEEPLVIRVMNVLRLYREDEIDAVHELLGRQVREGGLVIEGTSSPDGAVLTAHLLRRRGSTLVREGLLFFTDGRHGTNPWLLRDWLPRDLRRRVKPGTPLHGFFERWVMHWQRARVAGPEGGDIWARSAWRLAAAEPDVDARHVGEGIVVWRPALGVPRARSSGSVPSTFTDGAP